MPLSRVSRAILACGLCLLLLRALPAGEPPASGKRLNFEDDVVPIFRARCFSCHGAKLRKAGLDLRRRFTILKGGESGSALTPGKPDDSLLVTMVAEGLMPPDGKKPLDKEQIRVLKQWVAGGAVIRGDKEAPLEAAGGDSQLTAEDREFWSFKPPARPRVPAVKAAERVRNPIDAFLLAKLEAAGAGFNPDAAKRTLMRRVCFDLLGLPPTPEELDEFLADRAPDAYERLVDRLLASPRYGERWGRHWLDVAGYADSDGYLAADRLRPEAYRYRDYVIRAFNDDKPFDRFTLEQIAGDELADWRRAKRLTPELVDNLTATGFLRTALDPTYGNYKEPLECYKVMADTTQIVSSTFLGLTLQCARCHSHKSDPIPQSDYYRLHAIFLASYDPDRWQVSSQRAIPLATEAEQQRITKHNQAVDARLAQLNKELAELTQRFRERLFDEDLAHVTDAAVRKQVQEALVVDEKKRSPRQKQLVTKWAPKVTVTDEALAARFAEYRTERASLQAAIAAEQALKQSIVQLRGLMDLDDKPAQAHVLVRADWNNRGKPVEPGVPRVLTPANYKFRPESGYQTTGRRLALARWLVDPQNPLTARVQMNRLWMHHFGRGIVATPANFGHAGARPTHPKLLDYLATEFIAGGWSLKRMHRLMVTSTAYRQSSQPNPRALKVDPTNDRLGSFRPQRLEGEVVRDSVLAVTGKLNRQMFGTPVPVNRSADGLVTVADTPAGNRPSVYLIVRRSQPVTLLELFDTPLMEINCPQRTSSIVVTQSLTLMNSRFTEANAQALADRILSHAAHNRDARIAYAYRLLFAREPRESEQASVTEFLDAVRQRQLAALMSPPTQQQQADALGAGWRELAIVLLNSNEFLFVH
jgi:hypothetical protein